jgi:hypothetical protein
MLTTQFLSCLCGGGRRNVCHIVGDVFLSCLCGGGRLIIVSFAMVFKIT